MKEIRQFIKESGMKKFVVITTILGIIGIATSSGAVKIFQKLLDSLESGNKVTIIMTLLVCCLVVNAICYFVKMVYRANGREKAIQYIRLKLFDHTQKIRIEHLQDLSEGAIITANESVDALVDITHYLLSEELVNLVFGVIINIAILLTTDIKLTLICIGIIIPMGIGIIKAGSKFGPVTKERTDARKQMREWVARLNMFTLIKSFARYDYEHEKFKDITQRYKKAGIDRKAINRNFVSLIIVASSLLTIVISIYAIIMVPNGTITVAEVLVFYTLAENLISPFYRMVDIVDYFSTIKADYKKYREVMDLPEELDGNKSDGEVLAYPKIYNNEKKTYDKYVFVDTFFSDTIKLNNVSFRYYDADTDALKNINLTIHKGEKVGIYGESGGGKSSLAKLLTRLYRVTSGGIFIDGVDINEYNNAYLKQKIGLISQNVEIFSNSTILENIKYSNQSASDSEVIEAAKKANAHEFISKLPNGYDSYVGNNGVKLSGGEAQRIALARLFLLDPPIIVLDEATSKLDNESEKAVQEAIDNLPDDKTIIAIAHRLSTIKNFDTLYGILDGEIVESGTNEELIARPDSIWSKYNC